MTSGKFKSFPVNSIWVDRDKRQRKELTGIEELANSIQRVGLIHPPVIRRDGELVVGERRFTAVKSLGWTSMMVQFIEDLDEDELQLVEWEENIKRVDIPWQDECKAVAEYHTARAGKEPEWSIDKTAEAVGVSSSFVQQRLQVAKELEAGNARVLEAPKFSTARGIVERAVERKKAVLSEQVLNVNPITQAPAPVEKREAPILHADFHSWASEYSGPKFNFIHCDFPYGVNADKHDQGAAAGFGGYADTFENYSKLCDTLHESMNNVIAESAHLMFWFSMDYYQWTKLRLEAMGWKVSAFPLVWHKSDNSGILPDPKRGPRRIYETCFHASRGDRLIVQAVSNHYSAANVKDIHMSQKNEQMLKHFMRMFVDDSTIMLDPTCGSASAVRAAYLGGASSVLGLEANEEFFTSAKGAFFDD